MCSIFAGNGQKKAHCKEYDWQVPQSKMLETSRPNWTDNQKLDLPTRPACNHQIGVYSYVLAMDERKSARGLYDGLCLRGVAASVAWITPAGRLQAYLLYCGLQKDLPPVI